MPAVSLVKTIDKVDAMMRILAFEISDIVAALPINRPLSSGDVDNVMRSIDSAIRPKFGASQRQALRSNLYRVIVRGEEATFLESSGRFVRDLDRQMAASYPERWRNLRKAIPRGDDEFAAVYGMVNGTRDASERNLRALMVDPERRWVSADGYSLSDRVWRNGRRVRKGIDRVLMDGVNRGDGPVTVSRRLNRYLNPDFSPIRYHPDGRITRIRVPEALAGDGAGVNASRVLARTELAHVNRESTKSLVGGIDIKGAGVKWNLSREHIDIDECDDIANGHSRDLPRGVYTARDVPDMVHPQDLCFLTPYMPSRSDVLDQLEDRYGVYDFL